MPVNKNAMTRYQVLDELLSNRYHDYTIDDMTRIVNERLDEMGISPVTRRCIEMDIHYLEYDGPYMAEIKRIRVPVYNPQKRKTVMMKGLKYVDPSYSIFKKEMSSDEKYLLSQALDLLGQFDGLPTFEALQQFKEGLRVGDHRQIVSFTKNPLENSSLFGELFIAISQKQVIRVHYHKFGEEDVDLTADLHPYFLKEYNRRWYIFGQLVEEDMMICFALDRMNGFDPLPGKQYKEFEGDINDWFEDIIGVTRYVGKPVEHVVFWVSDKSKSYVATKPMHESQKVFRGEKDAAMRSKYPMLEGGMFFSVDCMENYELYSELLSFGAELVVLEPVGVREELRRRVEKMMEVYGGVQR